jgi:CspA family cold shock protein
MPTGKVKFYDNEKGFGFLQTDEGEEVFLHASALPAGVLSLKNGTRVEFGVAEGRKGMQALSVRILEEPPSIAKSGRKGAEDMAIVLEDVIKLLDSFANSLRRGRYPEDKQSQKVAAVLRGVADNEWSTVVWAKASASK